MMKRIALLFIVVVILVYIIVQCIPNEKKRLKQDIINLEHAVEDEDKATVLKYIDSTYHDQRNMTYDDFVNNIDNLFAEADSIHVILAGLKVYIDSTSSTGTIFARCSLGLKVSGRYQETPVLFFGGIIKPSPVKAWFKKAENLYQVYDADY